MSELTMPNPFRRMFSPPAPLRVGGEDITDQPGPTIEPDDDELAPGTPTFGQPPDDDYPTAATPGDEWGAFRLDLATGRVLIAAPENSRRRSVTFQTPPTNSAAVELVPNTTGNQGFRLWPGSVLTIENRAAFYATGITGDTLDVLDEQWYVTSAIESDDR